MNLTRLVLFIVAGCCLVPNPFARAQAPAAAPFTPDKQYSAEQVISANGMTMTTKVFVDNGKVRSETNANGMNVVAIMRPDQKKMYSIMPVQKMVMEMPLNDTQVKKMAAATGSGDAKFTLVGPDTVDGAVCMKYKMTLPDDSKGMFWWVNAATKTPVKAAAEDGTFTMTWKNYKVGPQDAALFEPPADYQVMQMPATMAPGGGPPGGAHASPDAGGAPSGGATPPSAPAGQ
jgi:hypothetical protein